MPTFILPAPAFARALQQVVPAVSNNPVVPILENVHLHVTGSALHLRASNLETDLLASCPVEASEDFAAAVPAKKLLALLKGFPSAPLTCQWNPDTYAFALSVGRSKYKLAGENPADFPRARPAAEPVADLALPAHLLRELLRGLAGQASTDDLRPAMCAVFVEVTAEALRFTATNGNGLAYREFRADNGLGVAWTGTGTTLLPRSAADLLAGLLDGKSTDAVGLTFDGTGLRLRDGRWLTRAVDDRFPDYRNVIPVRNPNVAVVERDELLVTVRRLEQVAGLVENKFRQVNLALGPEGLAVRAEDVNMSAEGSEVVACAYDGEPLEIGFNAAYLVGCLNLLPAGPVRVALSSPNRAALFTAEADNPEAPGLLALLMPVMVNQYV